MVSDRLFCFATGSLQIILSEFDIAG